MADDLSERMIYRYLENISVEAKEEIIVKLLLNKTDIIWIIEEIKEFDKQYGKVRKH